MKEFIQHLVKENMKSIAKNSYLNYGVKGLHMIDLIDEPTKGLKLYIAVNNNNLQNSLPQNCGNGITYPFQQYGKNIVVHCIKGGLSIWTVEESLSNVAVLASEYEYTEDGSESILKRENVGIATKQVYQLISGQSINLPGDEFYNFGTRFGNTSAWLVYEGRPTQNDKQDLFYTNNDREDNTEMYVTPTGKDIVSLLNSVGLI